MTSSVKLGEHNCLQLAGDIDFNSVPELMAQGQRLLDSLTEAVVDFSAVTKVNSAGLVLMLTLLRFANKNNMSMHFVNVPASLKSIAKLTAVEPLLWIN